MVQDIIYIIIFQMLFLIAYDLFHKKDTFFSLNRIYLIGTSILGILLPFIKIGSIREAVPDEYVISLPPLILGDPTLENVTAPSTQVFSLTNFVDHIHWPFLLYVIGLIFMTFLFIKRNLALRNIRKKSTSTLINGYTLYTIPDSKDAFSFLKTIYIGEYISEDEKEQIIVHELIHLKEKHSLDLLWFEFLKIIFWFNPLVYIYQSRINTLHEFIADAKSISVIGKRKYYEQLLTVVFDTEKNTFINQFFNTSLLKIRLQMIQKAKSKEIVKFKYLAILPILILMIVFSSFSDKEYPTIIKKDLTYTSSNDSLNNVLKKKFEKELTKMITNNASIQEITDAAFAYSPSGIMSREQYIKHQVYFGYVIQKRLELKKTNNQLQNQEEAMAQQLLDSVNRSYEKYHKSISKKKQNERPSLVVQDTVKKDIPFAVLDKVPSFESCQEFTDNSEIKKCVSQKIQKIVATNFKTEVLAREGLEGVHNIYVRFKIDTTGNIVDIQARGPIPAAEAEAKRAITMIPQMIPGEQNGEKVGVLYSLPIVAMIKETGVKMEKEKQEARATSLASMSDKQLLTENLGDYKDHNVKSGYYLVTNIFKRPSYAERGLNNLRKIGLPAKAFNNPKDKYIYVYLERYDNFVDAKTALGSNFNDQYFGDTYILKVITE